ncbi:MAG TPA: isoprenylcysteine carboxylmethyltransferase family protein [Acidobacteriota bacterium]|jgi:protein-S-isoprenylcysteine O-methyltransferase Ste14|nr:isoprenylcysteine carboxylmethyltransferase family protein [Acidobacteriota bacterium]
MTVDFHTLAQRIRVPFGFVFAAFFLIFTYPNPTAAVVGFGVALAGLTMRLWASGCIEKSRRLEVIGPYQYTRNPLYLGSFLLGLGACVAAANIWLLATFIVVFWGIYGLVMRREEEEMQKLFPEKFPLYRRSVPLFMPRFRGGKQTSMEPETWNPEPETCGTEPDTRHPAPDTRFRWSRAMRNREYNAVLGFVAIFGWICFRLTWKG